MRSWKIMSSESVLVLVKDPQKNVKFRAFSWLRSSERRRGPTTPAEYEITICDRQCVARIVGRNNAVTMTPSPRDQYCHGRRAAPRPPTRPRMRPRRPPGPGPRPASGPPHLSLAFSYYLSIERSIIWRCRRGAG